MGAETDIVQQMSSEQAWAKVAAEEFGRLAFCVSNVPYIAPINYCVHEGRLYFRTSAGSKLLGITVNPAVSFEIDHIEGNSAWSVLIEGTARELTHRDELDLAEGLPLRPWVPTLKYHYVEVSPQSISGREFVLGPEPERW